MLSSQIAVNNEGVNPQTLKGAAFIKNIIKSLLPKRLSGRKRPVTSSSTSVSDNSVILS